MSGKLHELLALEEDRRGKANKILEECESTFKNKQEHFRSQLVTFRSLDEKDESKVEGQVEMVSTVDAKLKYVANTVGQYYDVLMQKEKTNALAKADIVLSDGTVFLKDVPATGLLALEKQLQELMRVYNAIPTLEPGLPWKLAPDQGDKIFTYSDSKVRTKKEIKAVVLYPATDKHPAQVSSVNEDVKVGNVETIINSSKFTSKRKSEILERLDNLKTAVKQARMRANTQDIQDAKVGEKLFKYLNE